MARKLTDIAKQIELEGEKFDKFLHQNFSSEVMEFINTIKSVTSIYLFSGIIRDYFIKDSKNVRDIDLIYGDNIEIEKLFENLNFKLNNFGGYKTTINDIPIDIWRLENSWGLKNGQIRLPYSQLYELTTTTFFNFSSIIYSFNEEKFIYGKPFLQFMQNREIDIVSPNNPYPELCIINSFYYASKLRKKFSKRLTKYLIDNYHKTTFEKFEKIQLKHFNEIILTESDLAEKMKLIEMK